MKYILFAMFLLGSDVAWEKQEVFGGLTCPTLRDANVVASIPVRYMFADTVLQQTRCTPLVFNGRRIRELDDFSIGGTLFSFTEVEVEGWRLYVLNEKGEGWVA